eukprot:5141642-Amphidinium_carterae.1
MSNEAMTEVDGSLPGSSPLTANMPPENIVLPKPPSSPVTLVKLPPTQILVRSERSRVESGPRIVHPAWWIFVLAAIVCVEPQQTHFLLLPPEAQGVSAHSKEGSRDRHLAA